MSASSLELLRQLLRWLSIYLIGVGLPPEIAAVLNHPETVSMVAGLVALAAAEIGWVITKLNQRRR